jgi:AI-2 transport protein TqsA
MEPMLPPEAAPPPLDNAVFLRRLRVTTYSVVLFVLTVYLLEKFREILQPLFVALFINFLMDPIHRWLVRNRIPSLVSYAIILVFVVSLFVGVGWLMFENFSAAADSDKLLMYEKKLDTVVRDAVKRVPFIHPLDENKGFLAQISISTDNLVAGTAAMLSRFRDSTTWIFAVLIFLLFLIADKVSIPRRLALAFGERPGAHIMGVVESMSQAIGQYVAVKTLVSALAGILSWLVLSIFDVELATTWGILIFLLNFIPYLGSLIACTLPIVLSFLQFDEPWKPIVIACLLVGIQQGIGAWIEPRIAGQRLDVSPMLIVLSLAFWASIWGIPGAILAVPLLVIVKIILDNIPETRPIATLISNR